MPDTCTGELIIMCVIFDTHIEKKNSQILIGFEIGKRRREYTSS